MCNLREDVLQHTAQYAVADAPPEQPVWDEGHEDDAVNQQIVEDSFRAQGDDDDALQLAALARADETAASERAHENVDPFGRPQ